MSIIALNHYVILSLYILGSALCWHAPFVSAGSRSAQLCHGCSDVETRVRAHSDTYTCVTSKSTFVIVLLAHGGKEISLFHCHFFLIEQHYNNLYNLICKYFPVFEIHAFFRNWIRIRANPDIQLRSCISYVGYNVELLTRW